MVTSKKFLSIVLTFVMVFSVFSIALPPVAYAAAPVSGDYDELASLIRDLRAENNDILTVGGSGANLTASYDDATGKMVAVAEKYYAIFSGLKPTGTINQNTTSNRTATMINSTIKNQMDSRFTASEKSEWRIVALLDSLIANANVSSSTSSSSALTAPTITVTINDVNAVLNSASAADLPNPVTSSYVYKYAHSSQNYSSGSGCSSTTYYYVRIGDITRTTGTTSTTPIKTLADVIASYADYYTMSFAQLVAMDADELNDVSSALTQAYNAVKGSTAFDGAAVYEKYFADYDTAGTLDNINAAISIAAYVGLAEELQSKTELDITDYSFEDLSALYFDMQSKLENYNSAPAATRSFLEENGYIDLDAVNAKFDEITNAYEIAYLRDTLKPRIDADLELYATYDDDWTIATEGVEGIIAAAELELESVIADLSSRKSSNVEIVFGSSTADYIANTIDPVTAGFAHIREVNGYNLTFKQYQSTYNSVFAPLTLEESSTQLLNILTQRDSWYTELQAFVAELAEYDAEIAVKIFTDAEAAMEAKIDQTYAALNAILENEINDAWAIYQTQADEQGLLITEANLATYNQLKASIGLIEVNVYNFLDATSHFDFSEEAKEKYEALKNIVIALNNYDPSHTLSAYKYNAETLDPIIRYVSDKDNIRDRDFEITDEYLQNLIDIIDDLLTSGKLAGLGIELDLAALLDGVAEKVYTDKFVNNIMNALYPMLGELVRDKLLEMIPETVSIPILGSRNTFDLLGDLDDAFEKVNAGLSPKKVGKLMGSTYPQIANALKGVTNSNTSGFMYKGPTSDPEKFLNCWTSAEARSELYRVVVDENDEPVLDENGEPTYELIFDWGIDAKETVDEKREAFLDAMDASLKALQPVFMALLCNKSVPSTQIASIMGLATLNLGVRANDGYNNALIPILEAVGVNDTSLYDAKQYTNVRDIVEFGLVKPVQDLFAQLKAAPLDKALSLLPTVAFAIQNNLFIDLLHNLRLDLDLAGGGCAGSTISDMLPSDGVGFDLGDKEILDLADTLGIETFYEDILSMDGVLDIVLGLLAGDEEEAEESAEGEEPASPAPELRLPHMDGAKLAMLGTDVVWADSYRSISQITYEGRQNIHANIIANKPQVMQFLLEYILEAVQDDDFIPAIIGMINKDKPEEEQTEIPEAVLGIIENIKANGTDAFAAISELVHPVYRYSMPDGINWITEGTITEADYTSFWNEAHADGKDTHPMVAE